MALQSLDVQRRSATSTASPQARRTLEVANVIWCTGFESGFSWVHLPVFSKDGEPLHERGISPVPGFYFVGLHYLYAVSSATLIGVGRDAERIARAIAERSHTLALSQVA